jgi:formamidopyrimidine-DNA glycosylase
VRQFGYLKVVRDDELDQVKELNTFGPEPLDQSFTYQAFKEQLKTRGKGKIKQVLLDPKVVAGIGNIYSDEILFHAKILPDRSVQSLSETELKAIHRFIPIVLQEGIKHKGSSVGDFVRTDGAWGSMGKFHFVYGRKNQLCKKCKTKIISMKLGGRTSSFCPTCQK